MFKGYSCIYPEGCDNFGKTPFGDPDDSENDDKGTEFSKVQESVVHILEKLKSVEYSMWDGQCQNEEYEALVEREEFYFFDMEDGKMFLFQYKWKYSS